MEFLDTALKEYIHSSNLPLTSNIITHQLSGFNRHERMQKMRLKSLLLTTKEHRRKTQIPVQKKIYKHARLNRKISILHHKYKHDCKTRVSMMLNIAKTFTSSGWLSNLGSRIQLIISNGMIFISNKYHVNHAYIY